MLAIIPHQTKIYRLKNVVLTQQWFSRTLSLIMEPDILDCSADHLQKCEASSDVIANLIFVSEGKWKPFLLIFKHCKINMQGGNPLFKLILIFFYNLPKLLYNQGIPLPYLILTLFKMKKLSKLQMCVRGGGRDSRVVIWGMPKQKEVFWLRSR